MQIKWLRTIYWRGFLLGYYFASQAVRIATKFIDYPLRLKPSLCSDIYIIGRKP